MHQEDDFDEEWYLATYPEVRRAVASGRFDTGYSHYLKHGRSQGRQPCPPPQVFSPEKFLALDFEQVSCIRWGILDIQADRPIHRHAFDLMRDIGLIKVTSGHMSLTEAGQMMASAGNTIAELREWASKRQVEIDLRSQSTAG